MTEGARALRIQLLIGFMCVALVFYFCCWAASRWPHHSGEPAAIGLGVALMVLPLIGIWAMVSTLRAGLAHQRLARIAKDDGMELDVSSLPRMPSGAHPARRRRRVVRDGARELDNDPRTGGVVSTGPRVRLRRRPQPRAGTMRRPSRWRATSE